MRPLSRIGLSLLLAGASGLIGCGGGSTTTTGGAITISLNTSGATVAPGGAATVVTTVTRSGGFDGAISIAVTGAPAGVTAGIGTINTTGTTSTAISTISLATSAAPGTYPITVTASGTGVSSASATYTLVISATAQSYTLSLAPTGASIGAGANGQTTVSINRSGFTGSVNLSVPNLPSGITAAFSANNTTASTSTLTVTVGASVAAGTYQLTVGGVASGQPDQLAFFTVTVPAVGAYTVSVAPTTINVVQGSSNTATVTVGRTGGFAGNVALTVTGNPGGLSAGFAPALVSGNTSTATFTATAGQTVGSYQVTIHGSAAGFSSDQTVVITVNVTASGGGGSGNAVLNFSSCSATQLPIWLAYQDGSGPWTVVTGANNVYTFPITQSRGGFAYVTQAAASSNLNNVVYYSRSELTSAPLVYCPAGGTNTMSGTVAGLSANQQASIGFGGRGAGPSFPTTTFSIANLFAGTFDLVAWRYNTLTGPSASDRLIIRRSIPVQNLGTFALLDFASGEAVAPVSGVMNVTNAAGGTVTAQMTYYSTTCTSNGSLYLWLNPTATFTAYGVPTTSQLASDFHNLIVGVSTNGHVLGVQEVFHTMGNRNITMPTQIPAPAIASLGGNYKRLQATFTIPAEYTNGASFVYYDQTASHYVAITATAGYLGGASAVLAMPTFTGLAGFLDSWPPATASPVTWTVQASGSNFVNSICTEGFRLVSDQVSGSN